MSKAFLARFPEFAEDLDESGRALINLTLTAAQTELNPALWGQLYDEGCFYLTADKLVKTPLGEQLRDPDEPAAKTNYAIEFERLARIVSMGARVI